MRTKTILITVIMPNFRLCDRFSAVSKVVLSIGDLLHDNGIEVYINQYSLKDWKSNNENQIADDNDVLKYLLFRNIVKVFPSRFREFVKDLDLFYRNFLVFQKLKNLPKPDLVLSWLTYGNSYGFTLSNYFRVPLITIYDNPICEEYKFLKGFYPFFKNVVLNHEKKMVVNSRHCIVYSDAVRKFISDSYGYKGIFLNKAFLDFNSFYQKDNMIDLSIIRFIYVGSFFNWHNLDMLVKVFYRLSNKYTNCELYLVGEGPEYCRLLNNNSEKRIIFTGKLDGLELNKLMDKVHVGIVPNALWYQAPMKLFQYVGSGLAVITIKTPTICELTNSDNSILYFSNEGELFNCMESVILNPDSIFYLSVGSKKLMDTYRKADYLSFFQDILY